MPRITEPAGTSTRPFFPNGASVVASKRSSTFAVPEFKWLWRRTSNSVPTGISVALSRLSGTGAGGFLASLRNRSMRSSRSIYSPRVTDDSFRSFTFR
jgi:hypothetical protein